jgi:hypothetical protein
MELETFKVNLHVGEELENVPLTVGEHSQLKLKMLKMKKNVETYEVQFERTDDKVTYEQIMQAVVKRVGTENHIYTFTKINNELI